MNNDLLQDFEGRSIERSDAVDKHRWRAYHDFFALDPAADRPLAFHWLLFTELSRELRADGHPVRMEPFPELPFPRRMWAGGEVNWKAWLQPGAELSRTTTIARATEKTGSSGPFLLASLHHVVRSSAQEYVNERQDVVFLPAESRPGAGAARPLSFEPEWSEPRRFGPVDVFRYSALTLNSHRIHYDAAYAKAVEGYPTLVVHGPFLASLLMQAGARQQAQKSPARFAYRSAAPVFIGEDIQLVGRRGEASDELAIIGHDGGLRVTATMEFRRAD